MRLKNLIRLILLSGFFLLSALTLVAGEINKSFLRGIAIEGYDPVAYFIENKAIKANSNYSAKWKKATW